MMKVNNGSSSLNLTKNVYTNQTWQSGHKRLKTEDATAGKRSRTGRRNRLVENLYPDAATVGRQFSWVDKPWIWFPFNPVTHRVHFNIVEGLQWGSSIPSFRPKFSLNPDGFIGLSRSRTYVLKVPALQRFQILSSSVNQCMEDCGIRKVVRSK